MLSEDERMRLWKEAFNEMGEEIASMKHGPRATEPSQPVEREIVSKNEIFLGKSDDGKTVSLNLNDVLQWPVLVASDKNNDFMRVMAETVRKSFQPEKVNYGVITNNKSAWPKNPHNMNAFAFYESGSQDFILSLASWANSQKVSKQKIFLFVDGLENATDLDFDARQNLRWLFLRGPARGVFPVVNFDVKKYSDMAPWLEAFRNKIIGYISDSRGTGWLEAKGVKTDNLGNDEFVIRQNGKWVKFRIPSL